MEGIFYWILYVIEKVGYHSPETVFVDGTHIKANAKRRSFKSSKFITPNLV